MLCVDAFCASGCERKRMKRTLENTLLGSNWNASKSTNVLTTYAVSDQVPLRVLSSQRGTAAAQWCLQCITLVRTATYISLHQPPCCCSPAVHQCCCCVCLTTPHAGGGRILLVSIRHGGGIAVQCRCLDGTWLLVRL